MNIPVHRRIRGFSLIEVAVALVVIALVLGSILVPITSQIEQRKINDTNRALDEIREALIGFAVANGRLPCPAQSFSNGLERTPPCGTAPPILRQGFLPWATLGVSKLDGWGHIFRYSVTPAYASSTGFTIGTARDITIRTRDTSGVLVNLSNNNDIPAVVLSHGKNGYGAFNDRGVAQALPAGWPANNLDENTNAPGAGNAFVSRVPQAADTIVAGAGAGGEFDDIVVWISPNILYNRMVAAGKLP